MTPASTPGGGAGGGFLEAGGGVCQGCSNQQRINKSFASHRCYADYEKRAS